jgi:hypothetical protein
MQLTRILSVVILSLTWAITSQASDFTPDIELGTTPQRATRTHSAGLPVDLIEVSMDGMNLSSRTAAVTGVEPSSNRLTNLLIPSLSTAEISQPRISTWRRAVTWGERIGGNVLNLLGIPVSVAGGTLVAVHHDLSHPLAQVGLALTTLGVVMDRGGNILLEDSQKEAAAISKEITRYTRKISKAAELSPEEVERLSDEFFGMSQAYQAYIGCASKADRMISRILSIIGPTGAITGATLMLSGELDVGPLLAVAGALAFKAEGTFRAKADAYDAQIARHNMVELAKAKARSRLGTSADSRISISLE